MIENTLENDLRTRAEQRVLACLLRKNMAICHCSWLMPSHFSHDQHGVIFAAIRSIMAEGGRADIETVFERIRETHPRFYANAAYLTALDDLDVHTSHIGYYAGKLLEPGERP
ncbi:DnaB-like helicase N-terminal domain-containing protein [Caballeronia cordobensis]|uniref:DnaB-like helicase N-terminal domain-containing protein n=1 Tax=Caballeronia cordobensis TaxID=1353886 RepID=UPI00045EE139|nr:DnaB domain protein helicase domain protein [Burkholderia sp. RPE67]